ncbi:hypothetical protein [Legionella sp. W05-934-2]|uniref:hypothetical protein n=1 Tax=Legionella sp. W05-934-2 TaxID=1198649 RepID=UPI003461FB4A
MNRWKNLDYNNISRRIFPIEQENHDKNANAVILDFFSSIECPNCQSDLIEPITHNFNKNIDVNMKCVKCNNTFDFSQIIEEVLEKYYAYEIMKAGAKGGVVPLSQCPKCHLGTFLSYENICIYCGNTIEDTYNPEFANELFIRNVNDYWDYTS